MQLLQKAKRLIVWPSDSRAALYRLEVMDGVEIQHHKIPNVASGDVSHTVEVEPGSRVLVVLRAIGPDGVLQFSTRREFTAEVPDSPTIDAPQGISDHHAGFCLVER